MEFKTEKLENSKVKFSFVVPAKDFSEAIEKAYLKNRSKIAIPGFRKGKAPRSRIELIYGKGIFLEDAFDIIFPEVYQKAIEESDIHPVSRPEIDVQLIEEGKDLEFTAEVYEYPSVTLGEYEGLEVKKYVHQVDEEDVEAELAKEQKKQARKLSVTEGMIEPKDKLNLDYSGSIDGVKFDGGSAEGYVLEIGSGHFIPGFEDQLIGKELGTEDDITVTFPENYHTKEFAGKEAVFHVKLNSVEREELPEINDDFVADVSEFNTLDEFKQDIKTKLQAKAEEEAEQKAKYSLFDRVVANAKFDLPEPMVEAQMDRMLNIMDNNMRKQGLSLDDFLKMVGNDKAAFREQYREQAKQEVSGELVMEELAKAVNYEVSDADIDSFISKAFEGEEKQAEEFKNRLSAEQKENISYQIQRQKTMDKVWESAKIETILGDEPVEEDSVETEEK